MHLVEDEREDHRARRLLARTANYGGGAFTGVLTEEYVSGTEYSVQGVAHDGRAHVLSVCEKIVLLGRKQARQDRNRRPDRNRAGGRAASARPAT